MLLSGSMHLHMHAATQLSVSNAEACTMIIDIADVAHTYPDSIIELLLQQT